MLGAFSGVFALIALAPEDLPRLDAISINRRRRIAVCVLRQILVRMGG